MSEAVITFLLGFLAGTLTFIFGSSPLMSLIYLKLYVKCHSNYFSSYVTM